MKTFKLSKINSGRLKEFSKRFFQDRRERTLQDLKVLEKSNPDDMRVRQKIAETYYQLGLGDLAVETFLSIAAHHEQAGFILRAIDTCKNILKIKPDWVDTNLKLSSLYEKVEMKTEAANQLRIAISHYARAGDTDKTLDLALDLVAIDPSNENRAKLAEIYQINGMSEEAIKEYEFLAKDARFKKNYDKLLHFYELILPHRPTNTAIIKDLCILYLRKKQPERATHILEQYKVIQDAAFTDLAQKARLMSEALKRQKGK